ncbi:MAG: NUDIX hydrolase [Chromatiales bacterium]
MHVAGALDAYRTGAGFEVVPIVGVIEHGYTLRTEPSEVQAVFEVPLSHLLDSSHYEQLELTHAGVTREFHAIEYPPYLIWGATAAMLVDLRSRLSKLMQANN